MFTRIDAYNYAMKLRKEEGLGRRRLYKRLKKTGYNICSGTIQHWLWGGKPRLKEFSEKAKRLTLEKAYMLGVVGPGDGYITNDGHVVGLGVIDEDFATKFKKCLEKIYGFECKRYIVKPYGFGKKLIYQTRLYSKKAVQDIRSYKVSFKEKNWSVPLAIKKSSLRIQAEYISGFADSQGSVHKREILLASNNTKGVKEIKRLLSNFRIRSSIQKRKNTNILSIHGRISLEIFYKDIGFFIKRKQEKLKKILSNYKRYYTPPEIINKLTPRITNYINLGYSQRKTAKLLGISATAVKNRIGRFKNDVLPSL